MDIDTIKLDFESDLELSRLSQKPDPVFDSYNSTMVMSADGNIYRIHIHAEDCVIDIYEDKIELSANNGLEEDKAENRLSELVESIKSFLEIDLETTENERLFQAKIEYNLLSSLDDELVEGLSGLAEEYEFQTPGFRFNWVKGEETELKIDLTYRSPKGFRDDELLIVGEKAHINRVKEIINE